MKAIQKNQIVVKRTYKEKKKKFEGLILKESPKHLKYAFLGSEKSKPVIIAADFVRPKKIPIF